MCPHTLYMSYQFSTTLQDKTIFECPLERGQCTFTNPSTHRRCKRKQYIGFDVCFQHLSKKYNVRIAPTTLPIQGKGLFATNNTTNNAIVFKPNQTIISYNGELITDMDLKERYGELNAPYAVSIDRGKNRNMIEDAACQRSTGSFANHKPPSKANAKLSLSQSTGRVILKATKNIRNGKEIFVSYGNLYKMNEPDVFHTTKYIRNVRSA